MQTFGGKTLAQCMIEFGIGGLHDTARDIKLKFVYTSAERSRDKAFILMGTKSGVQMALKRQVRRPCRQPQPRSRAGAQQASRPADSRRPLSAGNKRERFSRVPVQRAHGDSKSCGRARAGQPPRPRRRGRAALLARVSASTAYNTL